MGRDEDYQEQTDRERHEAQIEQMYQGWREQDTGRSDAQVHDKALEAARVRDTEAIQHLFGVYATCRRDRSGTDASDVSARVADEVASARAMAREAEKAPGVSKDNRRFLSLMWETVAVKRELDALGDAPQGLDYARAQGLKAELEELKRQGEAASSYPKLHWSRKESED